MNPTSSRPIGNTKIQDQKPIDDGRSRSLSERQNALFNEKDFDASKHLCTFTYSGKIELSNLKIVRHAIKNYPMEDIKSNSFNESDFILIEEEIFQNAFKEIGNSVSTDDAIKNKTSFPNNVVLVDIFRTSKDKKPKHLKIDEDSLKKGFAETHTVCLWKNTKNQLMIIDPSSSDFSERLKNCVHSLSSNQGLSCTIIKHPNSKFYNVPSLTFFSNKSREHKKFRDCVDIALKIGIVLNEGVSLYQSVFEVQHSINFLSNQSAINPIIGEANDGTNHIFLQSTRKSKRDAAINTFSFIPLLFKQCLKYDAWLEFINIDYDMQNAIIEMLTSSKKDMAMIKKFLEGDNTSLKRIKLWLNSYNSFINLKKNLPQIFDIEFKLKSSGKN